MGALLDTNIAIHLRDGHPAILAAFEALDARPFLSVITRVELEGGIYAHPQWAEQRRQSVAALLEVLPVVDFDFEMAETYGRILAVAGFSKRKIIDRMIAATALVEGMTLITINARDFLDVPGLDIIEWAAD